MDLQELKQKRVLVVDDDSLILRLLQTVLKDMVQVLVANGGAEALEIARRSPQPDLILLDVSMPGMSGQDVCRELKTDPVTREIPVVFSTAAGMDEDEAVGFALGAVDYITKPFRVPVVRARVRAHLETLHLYRQIRVHNLQLDQKVRERTQALEEEVRVRRQAEARLVHQVYHDVLTGLPNHLLLRRRLDELTTAYRPFALVLVSLIGFRDVNNTVGHQNGSQLLARLAARLHEAARSVPGALAIELAEPQPLHLVRLDGVTFGFLMQAGEREWVQAEVRRVLSGLEEPIEFLGMLLNIGAHLGVALSPEHGTDSDTVLRHAHIALEQAAHADDNCAVYTEKQDHYSARRLSLMGELRSAIQADGLKLVYQPQLELATGRIVSVEALLRWEHPKLGFVRPDEFIPLAEQTGVIRPLTAWVLRTAIRQCAAFIAEGVGIGMSVNLSARNLREPDLLRGILALLDEYGVPPERLLLEVTETAMMHNPDLALKVLTNLEAAGIRVSIDDFGTGYSSLGYLKRLPVSEVKIDRSFVMDMLQDKDDRLIVQTIIDMGHNLGLKVVAEGVEDQACMDGLAQLGCDLAQGYHLAKPIPAPALLEWLRACPFRVPAPNEEVA